MKYYLIITLFGVASCKTQQYKSNRTEAASVKEMHVHVDSFLFVNDTLYFNSQYYAKLRCSPSNLPYKYIDTTTISTPYDYTRFANRCIKEKVFNGNRTAEAFLIAYLLSRKDKLLDYKPERYRGEKVFLALLELASSTKCANNEYGTAYGQKPLSAIHEMINNVEGFTNIQDWYNNTDIYDRVNLPKVEEFDCNAYNNVFYFRVLSQAWKEGRITLKDYGVD